MAFGPEWHHRPMEVPLPPPEEIRQGIAGRLRAERQRLRLSQSELAERVGTSRLSIWNYEHGVSSPRADVLHAFHEIGMDVVHVITGKPRGGEVLAALKVVAEELRRKLADAEDEDHSG